MGKMKIAITVSEDVLAGVDLLVKEKVYPNRSRAIENALREKLERHGRNRLARECARLDPAFEQAMADEGLADDLASWPEY